MVWVDDLPIELIVTNKLEQDGVKCWTGVTFLSNDMLSGWRIDGKQIEVNLEPGRFAIVATVPGFGEVELG